MLVHHHTHVGCTLNIGLATQSVHAAAGDADIAEEQLHNAHGTRVLGAIGVLRLAQCVEHHAGTAGLCGGTVGGVHQLERFLIHAADVAHGVEGVALVMLLHLLIDTHRVLKRHVALGEGERRRGELGNAVLLNPGIVARSRGVPVWPCYTEFDSKGDCHERQGESCADEAHQQGRLSGKVGSGRPRRCAALPLAGNRPA